MQYRTLGNTTETISAIGLGCMGMTHGYGVPDNEELLATLNLALDLGINFWDTADVYGPHTNEELISKVLSQNRDKVFIATKFGFTMSNNVMSLNVGRDYMRKCVEGSLKRLKVDVIDLYYAHRIDPNVPVEEMVGSMAELVKEGKVRYLGLSEPSAASIIKASSVYPITAIQSEYSILTRDPEKEVLPLCMKMNISFVPFSPLARGLATNTLNQADFGEKDFRNTLPRFAEKEHFENNQKLAQEFAGLAEEKHCTPAQLALAWVLSQGSNIIPIPGTKKRKYLQENAEAVNVQLSEPELTAIEALLKKYPNVGNRYGEANSKLVNN